MASKKRNAELQVCEHLISQEYAFEHDSHYIPELSGNGYRPDFLIRSHSVSIIIEVDEDGHDSYSLDGECTRMRQIWNAFGKRVVFIRIFVRRGEFFTLNQLQLICEHIEFCATEVACDANELPIVFLFYPDYLKEIVCTECAELRVFEMSKPLAGASVEMPKTPASANAENIRSVNECGRCGGVFSRKAHLKEHLRKKVVCAPLKTDVSRESLLASDFPEKVMANRYICLYCGKAFAHDTNRYRHKKSCAKFLELQSKNSETRIRALERQVKQLMLAQIPTSAPE